MKRKTQDSKVQKNDESKETRHEELLKGLKDNSFIAILLVLFAVIVSLATFLTSLDSIEKFFVQHFSSFKGGTVVANINESRYRFAVHSNENMWVIDASHKVFSKTSEGWKEFGQGEKATDIAVGANGTLWILGTKVGPYGFVIEKWHGNGWDLVEGSAERIAVDPLGKPWVINSHHEVFKYEEGKFTEIAGSRAREIAIGADGSVWIIGIEEKRGGYSIKKYDGGKQGSGSWVELDGGALSIAVDSRGIPFVINSMNQIYSRTAGQWEFLRGVEESTSIGAGSDGSIWLVEKYSNPPKFRAYRMREGK